jgi:tetratricopeptide (TPR) repeat protein
VLSENLKELSNMSVLRYWTISVAITACFATLTPALLAQDELPGTPRLPNSAEPEGLPIPTPAPETVEIPVEPIAAAAAPAAATKDVEIKLLVAALQSKEEELLLAKQEIAKLKKVITTLKSQNTKDLVTIYYNKACIYRAARQYRLAEANFLQALKINPDEPAVHYNLGILYDDDLKDHKQARLHYKRFLELAPNDKDAPRVSEWLMSLEQ